MCDEVACTCKHVGCTCCNERRRARALPPDLVTAYAAGHTADVLDLAWSKSQFLLTASMDKTVRLWHISMDDCLRVFKRAAPLLNTCFLPRLCASLATSGHRKLPEQAGFEVMQMRARHLYRVHGD